MISRVESPHTSVTKPRVIVFDIGNVLVGLDASKFFSQRIRQYFPDQQQLLAMQHWIRETEDRYALGLMTTEAFMQAVVAKLGLGRQEFLTLWNDLFLERAYMLPFMRELRAQGYTLAICSNTNELHMQYLQRINPCFVEVQHSIFSYQVGALKPDLAIYRAVEEATGQKPAAHLFLDDLPENVAGARAAGWDAICFETPEQVQRELLARNIQFTPWKL
jgi:HAD superfamily hydrolase (TIGR01509 family)